MRLGERHHPLETFGKQPIIGRDDLAVRAVRRDLPQRIVVVGHGAHELLIPLDTDPRVSRGVIGGDLVGSIGAAVVDDHKMPVRVGLGQHALDALAQGLLAVEDRRHDADQRPIQVGR
jgi:hypothetical protein